MNEPSIPDFTVIPAPFQIGRWRIDPAAGCIGDGERDIKLERRAMEVLRCLARTPGETVTRKELEQAAWHDDTPRHDALGKAITRLRKAFGDDHRDPTVIATVPRVGYRLIAEVLPAFETPATEPAPRRAHLAGYAIGIVVMVIAVTAWLAFEPSPPARPDTADTPEPVAAADRAPYRPSLAVLPFETSGDQPVDRQLARAVTEGLIADLSRLSGVQVAARDQVSAFEHREASLTDVAQALDVRYVMSGSVEPIDGQFRVVAQLVDTSTNGHLWAGRYLGDPGAMFVLRDQILDQVVSVLAIPLSDIERQRLERARN